MFAGRKSAEDEVRELRAFVDTFGFAERDRLQAEIDQLTRQVYAGRNELSALAAARQQAEAALVIVRDEQMLQESGIYDYQHRLEDSVQYRERLDDLRRRIKEHARANGGAVTAVSSWTVNGSQSQGKAMTNELSRLMLRAYNGEADELVQKLRPFKLDAAIDRLDKSRAAISKLGKTMSIAIADSYHRLRIEELRLTADYLAKVEAEKAEEKAEKERLREEARARREFEAERARLLKEQSHYQRVLEQLRESRDEAAVADAEEHLREIGAAIAGVDEREANIRAGYVYVISNLGAFGRDMVKIGMTRRLDPYDRVRELGDASVPFLYDVHAIVFSQDAVGLEAGLHREFASRRVNLVNLRREFFRVSPKEVEQVLARLDGSLLTFVEEPEASEWHQSENARRPPTGNGAVPASAEPAVARALAPPTTRG